MSQYYKHIIVIELLLSLHFCKMDATSGRQDQIYDQTNSDKVEGVFIHAGAGYHALENQPLYETLMSKICKAVIGLPLREGLTVATSLLETSNLTNAGIFGGNLDLKGNISLDAAVMRGRDGAFGAIACCPAIQRSDTDGAHSVEKLKKDQGSWKSIVRPHAIALSILEQEAKGPGLLGRVAPMILSGQAAFDFAMDKVPKSLELNKEFPIEKSTLERWKRHLGWLNDAESSDSQCDRNCPRMTKRLKCNGAKDRSSHGSNQDILQDTVGVIVVGRSGRVLSSVSSCGMSLKTPGRIGEAGVFGAGIWAQDLESSSQFPQCALGLSASGQGEQIMKTQLATRVALALSHPLASPQTTQDILQKLMFREFLNHPWLEKYPKKEVGFILFKRDPMETYPQGRLGEIWIVHSTPSMAVVSF